MFAESIKTKALTPEGSNRDLDFVERVAKTCNDINNPDQEGQITIKRVRSLEGLVRNTTNLNQVI